MPRQVIQKSPLGKYKFSMCLCLLLAILSLNCQFCKVNLSPSEDKEIFAGSLSSYVLLFIDDIDPCTSNPCKNAQSCIKDKIIGYRCEDCLSGYYGPRCEERKFALQILHHHDDDDDDDDCYILY